MTDPFAYVSATLNLGNEPLAIDAGKPLDLEYAVAAWDGHGDATEVDKLAARLRRWAEEARQP